MVYQSPFRNNSDKTTEKQAATRRKAFYLVIAAAVILSSAPVAYMILNGWLGTSAPKADELINDEYYEENIVQEPVQNPPPTSPPEDSAIDADSQPPLSPPSTTAIPAEGSEAATPPPAMTPPAADVVTEHDVAQALATTATPAESLPAPTPASAVVPTPQTPAAAAAPTAVPATPAVVPTPAITPPPPPAPVVEENQTVEAESAEVEEKSADNKTQDTPKRVLRPLSPQELAALKAANDRAAAAKNNASPQARSKYGEKLFSHVRSKWYPPSPQQLNNRKLKAVIELNIASDGKVNSVKFITPSYVKPMDDSIRNLMNNLRQSKAPAPGNAAGTYRIELKN